MSRNNIADLLERYQRGECTPEEKVRVDAWFEAHGMPDTSFGQLKPEEQEYFTDTLFADIQKQNQPKEAPIRPLYKQWQPYAAAAAVFIITGAGILFFKQNTNPPAKQDVAPYTAMAILKTGGKTIILDQTKNGRIGRTITKSAGEQLAYEPVAEATQAVYDTIQIPAGGRPYTVKLSDGSRITLNAATTLRYPESFSKDKREQVELISGEIYAEIIHNSSAPLQIKTPGQLITDIGTEFNISAYPDEADARTTLVAGAVKVAANNKEKTLKPGEQTIKTGSDLTVAIANIQQVTAWKDGYFRFNGEHIDAIMRQLARWYNIEVRYEGKMTDEVFYGKVARKRNISEVLKMLEKTQKIHFKVEGRRVTVLHKS